MAWDEQMPLFEQAHAQRMRPLAAELETCQLDLLRRLDGLLAGSGWSKPERRTLRRALCELAADLADAEALDEATAAEVEALHDRHAETSLDDERRGALAGMKSFLEEVGGIDLGDQAFESEEALLQHARRSMRDALEREDAQEGDAAVRRAKRKSAAQRRREAEEAQASQSVRDVFRRLASALHPDRADDDADRGRRTALMQRVNQAYAAKDLLGLFALQLEIEQVDPEHLARAGSERMRHYNRVLAAQLAELQAEVGSRAAAFAIERGRRIDPRRLVVFLDEDVRHVRAGLAGVRLDLCLLNVPASAKRWVGQMRELHAAEDRTPFGLAFPGG